MSVTVSASAPPPPSGDWTFCALEGQFCAFSGTRQVRYGANNTFVVRTLSDGTPCTNAVFGDPIVGTVKHCDVDTPPPTLTITCPANITVASPNGSPVVVTYTVTTSGGSPPVTLNVSPPSGSSFAVGTTTVQANAQSQDGQTKSCSFTLTVTFSPPSGDWTFCASEGQFCAFSGTKQVRYGANNTFVVRTMSNGTPCTNAVFGDPIVGTVKHCDISSTVPVSGVGPQTAITCPTDAVMISPNHPGNFIPSIVNNYPAGTTFCLKAGVHSLDRSIAPRTGDTFVGEFGAVLDGTPFTTTDDAEGAFRAHNQDVDNITIRNLVIRNMRRGIHAFGAAADHWTIEYNEVGPNYSGVVFPSNSMVRNNFIHHNSFSGYIGIAAHSSIIENNEIANNGWEQKIGLSSNVTFRNNFFHHNAGGGIWYDSDNTGALVEGNRVEDNGFIGMFYEISSDGIIRNNIFRRNGEAGVFLSTSKNVQIYNNTFENNFRGITYFMNCEAFGGGPLFYDLTNVTAHDNTITVGTQSGALASILSFTSSCTATQMASYLNGSKNLTFSHNAYHVPFPTTGQYWYWGAVKFWNEWLAIPQDLDSTVSQ